MSALLRLRYALGRWLVAPVIRLPKKMTPPEIIQVTVGGKFTSPQAKPEFHLSDVEPETTARLPDANERALIWQMAGELVRNRTSAGYAIQLAINMYRQLYAADLSCAPPSRVEEWADFGGPQE